MHERANRVGADHAQQRRDVVYDAVGNPQWSTGTVGNANARLVVQNDGNLVLYSSGGQPLWNRLQ